MLHQILYISCVFKLREKHSPKCQVANYVRRSFIVYRDRERVHHDKYWAKYPVPLMYLCTQNIKPNITSFSLYYVKNDVINYFKYETENTSSYSVIPLYNYLKRNYTVMVIDYPYMYISNSGYNMIIQDISINVVKTPNGNFYLTGIAYNYKGLERCFVVLNAQNGRLLYISDDLRKNYMRGKSDMYRYSVPMANSFVVVIKTKKHKINIKVINLITEKIKEINYDMRNHLEENEIYLSTFFVGEEITEIGKSDNGVIFYKSCKFYIYVHKKYESINLNLFVFYENNKIVISLVSEGDTTNILMKKEYYVESRYDVSESYLYAVFFSVDDHTLMKSQTMGIGKALKWYYKNSLHITHECRHSWNLPIENHGDLLIVKDKSKLMSLINKQEINKIIKKNYQILSLTRESIEVFGIKDVINLIQNNMYNEIFIEISRAIRKINLTEIVINSVTTYLGTDCHVETDKTLVQLDSSDLTLYLVVFAYCPKEAVYKVLLLVSSMHDLLANYKILKPIAKFEIIPREFNHSSPDFRRIVNMIYVLSKNVHFWDRIKNVFRDAGSVDLISNKIITTNLGLNKIYYDMTLNRFSGLTASELGNVICALCIVKTITSSTSKVQKQASEL